MWELCWHHQISGGEPERATRSGPRKRKLNWKRRITAVILWCTIVVFPRMAYALPKEPHAADTSVGNLSDADAGLLQMLPGASFLAPQSAATGGTFQAGRNHVDALAPEGGDGSETKPYNRLTRTVTATSAGDTFIVQSGFRGESLAIDKRPTLSALGAPVLVAGRPVVDTGAAEAGPDLSELGGIVIDQLPIPEYFWDEERFIGSPSIAIMEDGTYIASHDIFRPGGKTTNQTKVFRSTNKGQSWTWVSTINNISFATLFTDGRFVYIMGRSGQNKIIVQKSINKGSSWGAAHVIGEAPSGMTPSPPVIHNNRIWFAYGGRGAMSAPLSASVLDGDAWTFTSQAPRAKNWFEGAHWTEAQIVSSPQTGVVVLPKTHGFPYTALIKVTDSKTVELDKNTGFAHLPGAEKKFACVYDPVSQKFYALTNPVLSVHTEHHEGPSLTRNTGAVFSSTDLKNWNVEKIFLYSPNINYEAFQYFNFAIDGDDLAVVARTALETGGRKPPRGHDANILSFHVIKDFRNLKREQVLVADTNNNRVLRYEANLTTRLAPLGNFTNQTAMTKPMGIAQGPDGDVYISEQIPGGRVLRFSSTGRTFKGVVATGDVDFTGTPESLIFGQDGNLYMTVAFGSRSNKIYKINTVTRQVTLFVPSSSSSRAGSGTLNEPRGIAVGPEGHLYVADRGNDRIRKFNGFTGEFMGNLTTNQRRPQALAWDPTGQRLLFSRRTTDADNDIARVLLSGKVLTLYTKTDIGLALGVQSLEGRVYWTDYNKNRIYVITNEANKTKATSVSTGLNRPGNITRVILSPTGL
jgi:DNA-binding beta-propeller fold protein YncE